MRESLSNSNRRLYYLAGFLAFWFLAICVRLVWLQLVQYGEFAQRAAKQQQRSIEVSAVRGNIYDRHGNELAMSVSVDSVYAVPSQVADVHAAAGILARILKADATQIEGHMRASHAFAWVARKIDAETSARIHALNLKGIYFQKESKRFYPKRDLAAQVIGYSGLDDEGLGGIERQFDARLKGRPGTMLISMDAKHRWFGRVEKNPDPGESVVLTIDEKIQYIAERELEQAMHDSHAVAGTIVVQVPRTGEVLALANRPTFNTNALSTADSKALKNRAVSDIYEPGSTFKMVTLAAALEEKLTNPDEKIDCQMGAIVVNGLRIRDHKPFGELTVTQVLEKSSDVGAIKLALRLGDERFDKYIRAFGFGSQTGIELPGETRGITKPASRWSKVSIGAISMGQEIGVSALQLVSLASTMANDGVYVPTRIVAGITPPRSTPQLPAFHPAEGRRVISTMTAAQMKKMMEGVVLEGTGRRAVLNGYSIAGKTGTAQKVDPVSGAYSHRKHVASFAGFAPINDPAVTVLVVLDSPEGPQDGGLVAAPVFSRVTQQVLAYLNVPHDIAPVDAKRSQILRAQAKAKSKEREDDLAEGPLDRIAADASLAAPEAPPQPTPAPVDAAKVLPTAYKTAPSGPRPATAAATPAAPVQSSKTAPAGTQSTETRSNGTMVLDTGDGALAPNFVGKSLRKVLEEAQAAGIEVEVSGSGMAQAQFPAAGSRMVGGNHVTVRFGR